MIKILNVDKDSYECVTYEVEYLENDLTKRVRFDDFSWDLSEQEIMKKIIEDGSDLRKVVKD